MNRRQLLKTFAITAFLPNIRFKHDPFIVDSIFLTETVEIGYWINRRNPYEPAEWCKSKKAINSCKIGEYKYTPYVERKVVAFIYERFAGIHSNGMNPRAWGEIELTERFFPNNNKEKECSKNCYCRCKEKEYTCYVNQRITNNTKHKPIIPYDYRLFGFKRQRCSCGQDAFIYYHDNEKTGSCFSCFECQRK